MTTAAIKARIGNRWNTLKYLDKESKLDLITLLIESMKSTSKKESVSPGKYYGIWGEDGMTAEEFVNALEAERKFNQNIVEL